MMMDMGLGGMTRSSRMSMLELRTREISGPCTSMLEVRARIWASLHHTGATFLSDSRSTFFTSEVTIVLFSTHHSEEGSGLSIRLYWSATTRKRMSSPFSTTKSSCCSPSS